MTPPSDDPYEMSGVEMSGASGRAGSPSAGDPASVTQFLLDLRALGEGPVPEPSDELAALLGGVTLLARRRRHAWTVARRVALGAAVLVAGTTVAAASHSLPQPAQRVVSNVVDTLTPFHIDLQPRRHVPAPSAPPSVRDELPSLPVLPPPGDDGTSEAPEVAPPSSRGPEERASAPSGDEGSSSPEVGPGGDDRVTRSTTGGSDDGGDVAPASQRSPSRTSTGPWGETDDSGQRSTSRSSSPTYPATSAPSSGGGDD